MVTNGFKKALVDGAFAGKTLKAILLDGNHTDDPDAQVFADDINGNEIAGTNYTAGGIVLVNVVVTQDNGNDRVLIDSDDPVFVIVTVTDV